MPRQKCRLPPSRQAGGDCGDGAFFNPPVNVGRVEAKKVAPLHEGDPTLRDETTHMPYGHSETVGNLVDVHECRSSRFHSRLGHVCASSSRFPYPPTEVEVGKAQRRCQRHCPALQSPQRLSLLCVVLRADRPRRPWRPQLVVRPVDGRPPRNSHSVSDFAAAPEVHHRTCGPVPRDVAARCGRSAAG